MLQALLAVSRDLAHDRRSVTVLEYALIAAVMMTAIAVTVPLIGTRIVQIFGNVAASF